MTTHDSAPMKSSLDLSFEAQPRNCPWLHLRQGRWLNTSETKLCSSKERKPPNQSSKTTKSSPCTHARSPWTNATPPGRMHANHLANRAAASALLWSVRPANTTGQTGAQHMNRTSTITGDLNRSDRCTTKPRNGSKPPENLLGAFSRPKHAQTSSPSWQCMNEAKKCNKCNIELLK
jgi:hypothetical protein